MSTYSSSSEESDESTDDESELELSTNFFYHYTTGENAKDILESKVLLPSTDEEQDCLFGVGIYFTTVTPSNPKS